MYRFDEIWDFLIQTELLFNLKKRPHYIKWLLNAGILLSFIVLVIVCLQYLFWRSLIYNKIYIAIIFIMISFNYLLFIFWFVVDLFNTFRTFNSKSPFIFLSLKCIQYYDNKAYELCQLYKLHELHYALSRIHIIIQREENRIDNYNVGWVGLIAPIITLLLNRGMIVNLINNAKGILLILLVIFMLIVAVSFILFITFGFTRFIFKEKLNPYKYKIAILEIAILQKETEEKAKKKRFYFF